jgi:hypothetical protein
MMGRSGGTVATRIAMMDRVLIVPVRCRDGTLSERAEPSEARVVPSSRISSTHPKWGSLY